MIARISAPETAREGLVIRAIRKVLGLLSSLDRRVKKVLLIGFDLGASAGCVLAAYYLRVGEWPVSMTGPAQFFLVAAPMWLLAATYNGTYAHVLRFSGQGTILALGRTSLAMLAGTMFVVLIGFPSGVPRTMPTIHAALLFLALASSRVFGRWLFIDLAYGHRSPRFRRVLVYGTSDMGQQLANAVRKNPEMQFVGFIDNDPRLENQFIDGGKVFSPSRIGELADMGSVTEIFLALPEQSRHERRRLLEQLAPIKVRVRSLPDISKVVHGEVGLSDLSDVDPVDLLGREPVPPSRDLMSRDIAGKTVMVTGAGGSIGSELCRQIAEEKPARLVAVEKSEPALYAIEMTIRGVLANQPETELIAELADIANENLTRRLVNQYRPDTIYHSAAYKHVPLVESNPLSGIWNNVFGTLFLVRAALACQVEKFILISTDKAVRPTNIMGATKRVCEQILQAHAASPETSTTFSMVRFGNVIGSSGSVVPMFKRQIEAGGPVTVTHRDITRYFMTIPEAASLVIQSGAMARGGEVFVLDMGSEVQIVELAKTMIFLSGRSVCDEANPHGDIEIREIGLRPGEKLFEELLIDADAEGTAHPRILKAKETCTDPAVLFATIEQMGRACAEGDDQRSIALLKSLVPEFGAKRLAPRRQASRSA